MEIDNVHMRPHQEKTVVARIFFLCFRCKNPGHRMIVACQKFPGSATPSLDASKNDESISFRSYMMDMKVVVNERERIALIDCGANHNLIRPYIVDDTGIEHVASEESFDGHIQSNMRLRLVQATVEIDGMKFDSIALLNIVFL
ncbi:hypothetical protein PsorP6_001101 [Peronosclerospora sorghi]|uniref:Uncharacterized protein n=1 Tax=Peronosclerospora sorghi TaxID=230839 RepID=A0ACC0WT42_9STRA|nr:hypothetical protein PsorP6_001101 [Peronosclerospora sorghi]